MFEFLYLDKRIIMSSKGIIVAMASVAVCCLQCLFRTGGKEERIFDTFVHSWSAGDL